MAKKRRKQLPLLTQLKDIFVPHARNNDKPHYFRTAGLTALIIGILVLEGAYFAQTKYVFRETDFLASVLPGVLASLTNDDRADLNLPTLIEDADLARAAQLKADDMAEKGYFSHVSPDGSQPWHWLQRAGYEYSYAGENLAVNFNDSTQVEEAWMNSPTHRANIVKKEYTRIGIGVANGMYEGKEATFVVQFFATPANAPAPTKAIATTQPKAEPAKTTQEVIEVETEADVAEPAEVVAIDTETDPSTTTQVLGTETGPAAGAIAAKPAFDFINWAKTVLTSPSQTANYFIIGVLVLTLFALLLATLIKIHVQHPSIIMAAALLITVYAGALYLNSQTSDVVKVGDGTLSASAFSATQGAH